MVDFTALTVADGTSDDIKREVASKYADSPVNGWLAESFQTGVPKVLDGINPEDTDEVEAAVRGCAKLLGIGYRVSAVKDSTAHPGKKVLSFVGKNKKNVQPRGPLTDEQKAQRAASRAANKAAKEKAAAATPEAPKSARGSKR
jgi:hypothetical protein